MGRNIPVYLFIGFLESGKTKFIQETLEDSSFNNGDPILLLVCEEGLEEYDPSSFASPSVYVHEIENEEDLQPDKLEAMLREHRCRYVMVEYNGMWLLDSLYNNMPKNWVVAQEFLFLDARSFLNYNTNMRQFMVDKLQSCELAVLNRFPVGNKALKTEAHKIIRAINRRCDIAFETPDEKVTYDEIELPLPYDLEAPVVVIKDEDYALFLQDISEEPEKYEGKTVQIKGKAVTRTRSLRPGYFFLGRDVMTCCINDIRFLPLSAECRDVKQLQDLSWYTVTARVDLRRLSGNNGMGPVLHVNQVEPAEKPKQEVATFY